ncbi:hypothetical protein MMC29_007482 [Sticta canariensis]|nr:hypothetical protein [Sticta canariensis]
MVRICLRYLVVPRSGGVTLTKWAVGREKKTSEIAYMSQRANRYQCLESVLEDSGGFHVGHRIMTESPKPDGVVPSTRFEDLVKQIIAFAAKIGNGKKFRESKSNGEKRKKMVFRSRVMKLAKSGIESDGDATIDQTSASLSAVGYIVERVDGIENLVKHLVSGEYLEWSCSSTSLAEFMVCAEKHMSHLCWKPMKSPSFLQMQLQQQCVWIKAEHTSVEHATG